MKSSLSLWSLLLTVTLGNGAETSLTIYNSKFGVVRETIPLELRAGENSIRTSKITGKLDPGTVILRDPMGKTPLRILEQKFRAEALDVSDMLRAFEGQTIPFRVFEGNRYSEIPGKIIRAAIDEKYGRTKSTIVELNGRFFFGLPGTPIFPRLLESSALKPELLWTIAAEQPATFDAELLYVTEGMNWNADYEAILAEDGNIAQLIGWITIDNETERVFTNARVTVVAGRINRVDASSVGAITERVVVTASYIPTGALGAAEPAVQRRNFDEYHEYVLPRPVTLREGETSRFEFVRAEKIKATRSFVYDGPEMEIDGSNLNEPMLDPLFGTDSNTRVVVLSEFKNDSTSHLGVPLPQGRFHFYRDIDHQLQFTGESAIINIPSGEMVRAISGTAFDLVAERRQINFRVSEDRKWVEETFDIKLRNRRKEAVEIRIVEHPSRWREWEITAKTDDFKKVDGRTIEFRVPVKPDQEKVLTYTVRYTQLPTPRN